MSRWGLAVGRDVGTYFYRLNKHWAWMLWHNSYVVLRCRHTNRLFDLKKRKEKKKKIVGWITHTAITYVNISIQ